jgi:predicted permease
MKEVLRRIWYLGRRSQFDQELDDEIRFHIDMRVEELQAEGVSRDAALDQARREFGSPVRMREDSRGAWQFHWFEDLCADLRYAARSFLRNRAFVVTAVACLVLGILPNIVLFNLAAGPLLSPPSVRDPKTLYAVILGRTFTTPMRQFRFVRDAKPIDGLVGVNSGYVNWRRDEKAEQLDAARVTDGFFEVTGVPLEMGRPIQSGETDVVVVSHAFWKNHLGGDPNVLGRRLDLDGRIYTIAGVLPSDHRTVFAVGLAPPDVYLPVLSDNWDLWVYARLPLSMTLKAATDRLEAAGKELDRVYPDPNVKYGQDVTFYQPGGVNFLSVIGRPVVPALAMLAIVAGLVLLMACANVAGVLLARASARTGEFAIRFSLGAARSRIVRQLMAETLLLALGATLAGLVFNYLLISVLAYASEGKFVIQPDWRLLTYSIAVGIVATFACGLMPALNGTRSGSDSSLKRGRLNGRWTLRGILVIGQLAVSVVLLCASLLFIRNLMRSNTMNPGFDLEHTLRTNVHLIPERYSQSSRRLLIDSALERLRTTPGIESASIADVVPFGGNALGFGQRWSTDLGPAVTVLDTRPNEVGTDYFRTLRIPILQGREFMPYDREGSPLVVILNQTMARQLFGTVNPVGHFIRWDMRDSLQIVGVASDSKISALADENIAAYYQPFSQSASSPNQSLSDLHFLTRASGAAGSAISSVNKVMSQLDPTAALDTKPMRENVRRDIGQSQVIASVLGAMGLLGLVLASVGLYGVLLYAVSRRSREIGVRIALGATAGKVVRLVVGESAILVGGGIAIGLGIAVFAVQPLAMFLIADVHPTNAINFVLVAATLCVVAALATISPMFRALRVDPITVLRHE